MLDDVSFIQTKTTPTNMTSIDNSSNNSISLPTSSSNKDEPSSKITTQSTTTSSGMDSTTEPISALDKATFPFPCYLEMVSSQHYLVKGQCNFNDEKIILNAFIIHNLLVPRSMH